MPMTEISITFIDVSAYPQTPLNQSVTVPAKSFFFSDWQRNIIAALKNDYGIDLTPKDIPQIKIRMDGEYSDPLVFTDDTKPIDTSVINRDTIISVRLPVDKTLQLKTAKQIITSTATIIKTDKADTPIVEEYKSPELYEFLHAAATAKFKTIKPVWATKNLMIIFDGAEKNEILFDLEKNKLCKPIFEQAKTTDTPLHQIAKNEIGIESLKEDKWYVAGRARDLFNTLDSLRDTTTKYQFVDMDRNKMRFWNTSNPEQITLDKAIDTPVSDEHANWMQYRTRRDININQTPGYFLPRLFPDKLHVMVKIKDSTFNFMDLKTGAGFSFAAYSDLGITIINNQQILFSRMGQYGGATAYSMLMTIDFKNKRAKFNEEKLFVDEKEDYKYLIPLSLQVVLKMQDDDTFTCHQVSPDGALTAITALTGQISQYTRLETGEFIYWDEKTKVVNVIDPFAQRLIPLLKLESVLKIHANGHDILILTKGQLHRVSLPDYQQRATQMLDGCIVPDARNLIMDYVGFNRNDKPHLLTKFSFLTVDESENKAVALPTKTAMLKPA